MQFALVTLLDAKLSDVLRSAVIAFFIAFFNLFFFFLVDTADVAHHVAGQVSKGVVAKQACFNFNPRKSKLLSRKSCNFFVCQA